MENKKDILFNFMLAEMNVIESLKYGDKILTSERIIKWYEIADELSKQIADVMQSVLEISVPFVVEVGQGLNWDAAH